MLVLGTANASSSVDGRTGYAFDFSQPLDLSRAYKTITTPISKSKKGSSATTLGMVLSVSGAGDKKVSQFDDVFESYGLFAASGIGMSGEVENIEFEPGGVLAVPLVSGDITMAASGTITDIIGDKVYGFGHSFFGYGAIDLPMATGKTHFVMASRASSFKVVQPGEIKGALRFDEEMGVYGIIGEKARMIPLRIKVSRYNEPKPKTYNCQLAVEKLMTPLILARSIGTAAYLRGGFGTEHTVKYKVKIDLDGFNSIAFENISTGYELYKLLSECVGSVGLVMNNPYEKIDVTNIEVEVDIEQKNIISHIWSAKLSDSKVKAGDSVKVQAVVESYLADKKKYQFEVKIPDNLKPGEYELILCGAERYEQFLRGAESYKFKAENAASMIEAINKVAQLPKDRLYCILVLPASGISLERAELVDLPGSKAIVLADSKRTVRPAAMQRWTEQSVNPGTIVIDEKVLRLRVER